MIDFTRRETLLAAGATVGLAGCVEDVPGRDGDDPDGNGNGNRDGPTYDVFQLGASLDRSLWAIDEDATGFVTVLESADEHVWLIEDPEGVDGLQSWIEATDFERSTVVYVESAGPNTCYSELAVDDVGVEGGTIVGTAEAVDTREEDEGCGSTETFPSALVRVTGDEPPDDATVTVTNGWGESGEVPADGLIVDPEKLPGHVRPDGDPGRLESFSCGAADFERHRSPAGGVELGAVHDDELTFAMRVHTTRTVAAGDGDDGSGPRVGRGDEVRISMWNVSDEEEYTGNRHKYNLEVLTVDGWRDVRGTADGGSVGYTDEAIIHRPGEGFEWTLEMTEGGVLEGHVHEDRLEVCPDLQPGRYRFVHNEASGSRLGVEFDYTD